MESMKKKVFFKLKYVDILLYLREMSTSEIDLVFRILFFMPGGHFGATFKF
jgi:hypothetical protein